MGSPFNSRLPDQERRSPNGAPRGLSENPPEAGHSGAAVEATVQALIMKKGPGIKKGSPPMKTRLLSACAIMMLTSAAYAAQDSMSAKPTSAMSASPAMSSDGMSSGMSKGKKSQMRHSKPAAKHKAAMHKKTKDAMSSSQM
jgi:hypothetical protein